MLTTVLIWVDVAAMWGYAFLIFLEILIYQRTPVSERRIRAFIPRIFFLLCIIAFLVSLYYRRFR